MAVTLILVLFSLVAYFCWILKTRGAGKIKGFPGPTRYPIIGNFWYFGKSEDRLNNITKLQRNYGNRASLSGGFTKVLVLFHPDDIGKILASRETNKSSFYDLAFTDWLGATVFKAKSKNYFKQRKMLTPPLDFKHIGNFELHTNEHSKTLVNIFKTIEATGDDTEIRELLTTCVLENSLDFAVGKRSGASKHLTSSYATAVHKQLQYVLQRTVSPWLWPEFLWKLSSVGREERQTRKCIHDFMERIVHDRKEELRLAVPDRQALPGNDGFENREKLNALDYLIREQQLGNPDFNDKYIRDELNAVIFAVKVHEELDEVFGKDRDRNATFNDLSKLKYLECCIKEALRIYTPPITVRVPENDFQLDKETTIPKGTDVLISPWVVHRLPEFWPEPEKFKPERFLPENSAGRHPYCYFPFSAGSRTCMGQKLAMAEEKIILSHLFRNFTIRVAETCPPVIPMGDIVVFPKNELKIKLKMR